MAITFSYLDNYRNEDSTALRIFGGVILEKWSVEGKRLQLAMLASLPLVLLRTRRQVASCY